MTLEEPQPSSSSSSSSSSSRMDQSVPSSRTFRLGRVQPQAPGHRTIFCNDRLANLPVRFTGNSISTTNLVYHTHQKRFQNDMAINNGTIDVLRDREWVSIPWKKLQVGDLVKVKQDEFFPADLLFLASTNVDGVCYIETANLDGETNLKIRKALEKTWDYFTPEKASEFKEIMMAK